jgi:threonine/homoserine/homoserine lactone efflux protein
MHVNVTDAIFKGLLVGLFMAISVGPTLFAVIRYSLSLSYKAGLAFVFGVSLSDIMFVTLANVAAPWLARFRPYEKYIAIGGAIILMIIGISGFLRKHKPQDAATGPKTVSGAHYFKIFSSGFFVNTLNPGALITWLGAVSIIADSPVLYRVILFATCLIIILSVDFSKVFLAEKIKKFLTPKRVVQMQYFSSACLFLIGAVLLGATLLNMKSGNTNGNSRVDKILSFANKERPASDI